MRTDAHATGRPSSPRILVLLMVLGCVAAGCRSDDPDGTQEASVTVDLETSRDQFRAELEEVERLLEPAQFTLKDGVSDVPGPCDLPDGNEGQSYLFYIREFVGHIDDPESKANLIAEHWRGKGYKVTVRGEPGFDVTAETNQGGVLIFGVGEPGMTLSGESPCVPA